MSGTLCSHFGGAVTNWISTFYTQGVRDSIPSSRGSRIIKLNANKQSVGTTHCSTKFCISRNQSRCFPCHRKKKFKRPGRFRKFPRLKRSKFQICFAMHSLSITILFLMRALCKTRPRPFSFFCGGGGIHIHLLWDTIAVSLYYLVAT